jgi:acyl carrier protein
MDLINEVRAMNSEEAILKIRRAVADCLGLEEEEVRPESRLIPDLGADSLDFVDLIFTMERTFGVKLREGDFGRLPRLDISSDDAVRDGFLTAEAVASLEDLLPTLKKLPDISQVRPHEVFSLITVETMWIMVQRQLMEKEEQNGPS